MMSKVHEKKRSGQKPHRKQTHSRNTKSSSLQGPSKNDELLSSENQRQRWRKIIITLTIILLLAGVVVIIVPILVSSNGVPAALPILGVICLLVGILLPVCFFHRKRLTRSCYDEEDKHSLYQQRAHDPENAIGEYQRSSNAANISFDSELGSAHGGCLQTTPKIFRFSKSTKSKQNYNHRFQPPPQFQPPNNIPLREKASEQIPIANDVTTNGDLKYKTQHQILERKADNTNLAFIEDEACREISAKYETNGNDQIGNKNHFLDNTGDGYFTTEEVDVDEELNNSLEILESPNSSNTEDFPNAIETKQQNSFISRQMFSNFQNSGKSQSKKSKKFNGSSIFSFKIKKSPKKSEAKGNINPLAVTDDLAPPSIVISPPTPSPKMSPPRLEQETQAQPSSIVKEETPITKKDRRNEPRKEKQPIYRLNKKNNSATISSNKTGKRTEKKYSKSKGKPKEEISLNEDTIYHFRDAEDDDPSDVVILAEAVISPAEVFKQSEKSNCDKKEAPSKRSMENEVDNTPTKKIEKANKSSNVFKLFNNNRKESDREKRNKKIKHSKDACDDYLMTGEAVKDSYINECLGNENADHNESSEESPPLSNFKNLKSNPDLAGMKFKNLREMKKFKDRLNQENEDDGSESGFSDVLKYVRKDEKKTGKVKKKKGKKTVPTTSRNNNYQAPKSRSIEEMNRKLVSMSASSSAASTPVPLDSVDKKLLETSLYVSFNPEGKLQRRHGGSMDSVDSAGATSIGSTGSYSGSTGSAGSIVNPMRSSMKKTKSRDRTDSVSTSSGKKSVHYAIGAEQTTV